MMHFGFDAKRVFNNFTGLGNYGRTLLKNLADLGPEHAYYLFSPTAKKRSESAYFFNDPAFQIVTPSRLRQPLWRSRNMIRDLLHHRIDLYHGLSHELPYGIAKTGIPSVVTIHDLIYRHYPGQYGRLDNLIYEQKFSYACRHASSIVAISQSTKRDIEHFFGIAPEKIKVIYQSCDERFLLQRSSGAKRKATVKYDLPAAFSLYVGSLIERKNLLGIVEALALLPADLKHPLVIIGGGGKAYRKRVIERAETLGVQNLLVFRQVDFADLPTVYQLATAFLHPSYYEGFGIPVIEALNSGVPVVTSNRSSLPEAAGEQSLMVAPDDYSAIANAWQKSLTDTSLRTAMIQAGHQHAAKFRSEVVTPQMMALYLELAD